MSFDFDRPIERRGTDSQKWQKYAGRDILPMWVADMDFASSPEIIAALQTRVAHGVFGYARPVKSTVDAVVEAMQTRYGWTIEPSWIVWMPGLVCTLNVTAKAFASPNEQVLTSTPVYPPFISGPKNSARESLTVPLFLNGGRWTMDFEALERAVTPRTKLFYLCNPHNPVARVYNRDELQQLGEFCIKHDLILCSDEIHCDLIIDDLPHIPTATLSPEIAARTITLMAPSKAYNIPGLGTSFAIISDPKLRATFVRACAGIVAEVTSLGFAACEAAYRDSGAWLRDLIVYLRGNRDYLTDFVARELPGVKLTAPIEATYLAWFNVEELGLKMPIDHFEKHGVGLSDGTPFGAKPGSHVRLNFGCTRATLIEGLARMKNAVQSLR
ncbi:MAG TPA: PatB family C-S lyase [Opitutaceae bacterium]|nr:PatB family C-S lyase [Opitutaceae bacterium]